MTSSSTIILVGVSGCGKSTLCESALHKYPFIKKLIAVTTRPSRQNEIDGIDKYFVTQKEFDVQYSSNFLCLSYEAYGYHYAFRKNDFLTGDTYISELNYRNHEDFINYCLNVNTIYIQPCEIELAVLGIKNRDVFGNEASSRIDQINDDWMALDNLYLEGRFNYQFINYYDNDSKIRFDNLIRTILTQANTQAISQLIMKY